MAFSSFISGALAGLAVDLSLFPVDTIKTRLQSKQGFLATGGFRNLYSGIGPVILGSAPGSAAFFMTYETSRQLAQRYNIRPLYSDMLAASLGEVMACVVRVPVEVIKQRTQTNLIHSSSLQTFRNCIKEEGFSGLFRGYRSTVVREIPFSFVQFPIWEEMKRQLASYRQKEKVSPLEGALCGFVSGGFAAAVTTPLDVVKTRIMLAQRKDKAAKGKVFEVLHQCFKQEGIKSLFAGVVPRTVMISSGGFIFLGVYEKSKQFFDKTL